MLAALACQYVDGRALGAPGASRRGRRLVAAKVQAALGTASCPILCVGEGLEIRQAGGHVPHCTAQLDASLDGLTAEQVAGRR